MNHKKPKNVNCIRSSVESLLSVLVRSDVTSNLTQIPLCAVANIEIARFNACRNVGILSIEIFFAEVIRETSRFKFNEN